MCCSYCSDQARNAKLCRYAPVAQLDRVPGYEPGGREFESLRARHSLRFDFEWIRFVQHCRRSELPVLLSVVGSGCGPSLARPPAGRAARVPICSGQIGRISPGAPFLAVRLWVDSFRAALSVRRTSDLIATNPTTCDMTSNVPPNRRRISGPESMPRRVMKKSGHALGWWKTRPRLESCDGVARYTLVVSIRAPDVNVDLNSAIANQIAAPVAVEI